MLVSMHFFLDALIYAFAGFAAVTPLLYLNVRYSQRLGLIDWPKARGLAEDHVPIVGPSLVIVAMATLGVLMAFFNISPWVLTSAAIIGTMGYFDDRRPLSALDKLFFQTVCALAVVYFDPQVCSSLGSQDGPWGQILGTLFIIAVVNAVNFIDGIDGLAGVVLLTAFGVLPLIGGTQGTNYPYTILACVMVGALIPFLHLNVRHRKGFLGNVGSYFFSFLAAVAHLSVPLEGGSPLGRLSLAALCFLVPVADAATVVSARLWTGRSPFRADKGHLHHRLVQTNIPLRYILSVLALVQVVGVGTSFFLSRIGTIHHPFLSTVVLAGYAAITATLILLLEWASRIRVQTYFQRLDTGDPIYYLKYRVSRDGKSSVSPREMARLEAKFAAEIRVTDICTAQTGNCLFIVLRTMAEPMRGISARLETVIHSEKNYAFHLIERGDFAKRLQSSATATKLRVKA